MHTPTAYGAAKHLLRRILPTALGWASAVCLSFAPAWAQQKSFVDIPTPTAASLGEYGQVPVNYFNGLPNVSVPLYTFKYREISVPLALNYHGGGIRTEMVPSWVGLGWSLEAGGTVTRQMRGVPDEIATPEYNIGLQYPFPDNGSHVGLGSFDQSILDGLPWDGNQRLTALRNNLISGLQNDMVTYSRLPYDGEPDEFIFSVGDFSGSFFFVRRQDGSLTVKVKAKGGEPLKIEPIVSQVSAVLNNIRIFDNGTMPQGGSPSGPKVTGTTLRTFLGFNITRADGTKYTFGTTNTASPQLNCIDFNARRGSGVYAGMYSLLATSWYLTRITAPSGYAVNLEYKNYGDVFGRHGSQYHAMYYLAGNSNCSPNCFGPGEQVGYTLQHPSYLARIVAPDGTGVEFKSSIASQLNYDHSPAGVTDYLTLQYGGVNSSWNKYFALSSSVWLKLDSIRVRGVRSIAFTYDNSATERLRLQKVAVGNLTGSTTSNYQFTYNSTPLPVYNAYQSDNWGFYNGKDYQNYITNYGFIASPTNNLTTFRTPDAALMQAQTLTKITYPTGGETNFTWEPHDYSQKANIDRGYISTLSPVAAGQAGPGGTLAGGLRIRRIESRTSASDPSPQVWEYSYVNADNTSSGVLAGLPIYHTEGQMHVQIKASLFCNNFYCGLTINDDYKEDYYISSDSPQGPLSETAGNHVTYARVVEKRPGNGYTVYTYSDVQTVPDEIPVLAVYNIESRLLDTPVTSRELERGLLLSTSVYDEGGRLLTMAENEYNNDPDRYNDFVKTVHFTMMMGVQNWLAQATATKIYTFYPYLRRKTVTNYGNGTTVPVVSRTTYTYNAQRLVASETSTDSQGQDVVTSYRYPADYNMPSNYLTPPVNGLSAMKSQNMLQYPVETVTTRAGAVVAASVQTYTYTALTSGPVKPYQLFQLEAAKPVTNYIPAYLSAPSSNTTDFSFDTNWLKLRQTCVAYDPSGNLLTVSKPDQAPSTYVWDYTKALPTAVVQNARYDQVAYAGFEADGPFVWSNGNWVSTESNNWKFDPTLGNPTHRQLGGGVTGNGYYRLDGNWSIGRDNLPPGDYELSFWAKGGIANIFFWGATELSRSEGPADANGYRPVRLRCSLSQTGSIAFDAYGRLVDVDDVRLYPVGAQMTTYTHQPQVGPTSTSDLNNQPTFYEYDGLQRLKLVRDQHGNIVKQLDYHYQQ